MRIETICENRKEMVKKIGEFLEKKPEYVGPPSYAYKIDGFTIERDGTVVNESEEDGERMRNHLEELGFIKDADELEILEVSVPIEDLDGLALKNLVFMIRSKEYLLNRVVAERYFYVDDELIEILQKNKGESKNRIIEILAAHSEYFSGFSFDDKEVTFTFPISKDPNRNRAYIELAAMMVAYVKNAKRISPKKSEPENEKYYLRVWLVTLGLGGKGAKESRKALLDGLKGHTAFRTASDAKKHKARMLERKGGSPNED